MYHFVDLTEQQRYERRHLLDRYAFLAQISAIVLLLTIQIYFAVISLWRRWRSAPGSGNESSAPSSPYAKHEGIAAAARPVDSTALTVFWRKSMWWLGEEISMLQSTRGEVLFSTVWSLWLLVLCFAQTGDGKYSFSLTSHIRRSSEQTYLTALYSNLPRIAYLEAALLWS